MLLSGTPSPVPLRHMRVSGGIGACGDAYGVTAATRIRTDGIPNQFFLVFGQSGSSLRFLPRIVPTRSSFCNLFSYVFSPPLARGELKKE